MNRGSASAATFRFIPQHASMRPRFMNRGSILWTVESGTRTIASMRPRFMNRGSLRPSATHAAARSCFNEAPIHESGKSGREPRVRRIVARFNEAPIHESGKCGTAIGGPRRRRRFNEAPIHESGKSASITKRCSSCWACFNEAPIHESGKYRSGAARKSAASRASMRPRFMNRGSCQPRRG